MTTGFPGLPGGIGVEVGVGGCVLTVVTVGVGTGTGATQPVKTARDKNIRIILKSRFDKNGTAMFLPVIFPAVMKL
jgi:hypothetical protein